jgi:hypothetical protein
MSGIDPADWVVGPVWYHVRRRLACLSPAPGEGVQVLGGCDG